MDIVSQSLAGVPPFLEYFVVGLALLGIFVAIYAWITPYRELALIRDGNVAAAIALAGVVLGFTLPLASAIAHSVGLADMILWGAIALLSQLVVYFIVARLVPHFAEAITAGRIAAATLLAAIALAVGILNAAALTY